MTLEVTQGFTYIHQAVQIPDHASVPRIVCGRALARPTEIMVEATPDFFSLPPGNNFDTPQARGEVLPDAEQSRNPLPSAELAGKSSSLNALSAKHTSSQSVKQEVVAGSGIKAGKMKAEREGQVHTCAPAPSETSRKKSLKLLKRRCLRKIRPQISQSVSEASGQWVPVGALEFCRGMLRIATQLIRFGIAPGDRILVLGSSSLVWNLLDLAIQSAGAVVVPIYDTDSVAKIKHIHQDSGTSFAFADTQEQRGRIKTATGLEAISFAQVKQWANLHPAPQDSEESAADARKSGLVGKLKAKRFAKEVTLVSAPDTYPKGGTETSSVSAYDQEFSSQVHFLEGEADLAPALQVLQQIKAQDLATIVYTSGTTGPARGVELTHRNLAGMLLQEQHFFPSAIRNPDVRCLLFLPMAHVFARTAAYMPLAGYGRAGHCPTLKAMPTAMRQYHPTTIGAVPRVLGKIYEGAKAQATGIVKGRVFRWCTAQALARAPYIRANQPVPTRIKLRYALADRLVFRKLTVALGGKLRCVVSGGARLDDFIDNFFTGIGVRIYNGYGLTESSGGFFCNTPEASKVGTVGRPLPGCKAKLADDGELLLQGIGMFQGYRGLEPHDAQNFVDGWFKSGDLGLIDDQGFVTITGRKKEILVTAGGKNVQPAGLEEPLQRDPLVSHVMVVGEGKKFVAALVTLDPSVFPAELSRQISVAQAREDQKVIDRIRQAIAHVNQQVSRAESIRRFLILDQDFTEENQMLTPSLKVKRGQVTRYFQSEIEDLYAGKIGFDVMV